MSGADKFLVAMMREEARSFRKFYLGYSVEQENVWLRYNRCCHPGRKIAIKPMPVRSPFVTPKITP